MYHEEDDNLLKLVRCASCGDRNKLPCGFKRSTDNNLISAAYKSGLFVVVVVVVVDHMVRNQEMQLAAGSSMYNITLPIDTIFHKQSNKYAHLGYLQFH